MSGQINYPEHSYLSGEEKHESWRVYGNEGQMIDVDQTFDSKDTGFEFNPDYEPDDKVAPGQ